MPHCPPISSWRQITLIAVFVLLQGLPLLDLITGIDPAPPLIEKRAVRPLPSPPSSPWELPDWTKALEASFRDRFGFRDSLIRADGLMKLRLWKDPKVGKVLVGDDGWLFYGRPESVSAYRRDPFPPGELEKWGEYLDGARRTLAARECRFLFAAAPNKGTVYPEFLPDEFPGAAQPGRISKLYEHLATTTAVQTVDLIAPLRSGKEGGRVYYRYDTHWNQRGAALAAVPIGEALEGWFPALENAPYRATHFGEQPAHIHDLADLLGAEQMLRELAPTVTFGGTWGPEPVPLPPGERSSPLSGYPESQRSRGASGLPRVLLFGDSFSAMLWPHVQRMGSETMFVWGPKIDATIVERFDPDVVILEVVERNLHFALDDLLRRGADRDSP